MLIIKNKNLKNILLALGIIALGFVLYIVIFLLASLVFGFYDVIFQLNPESGFSTIHFVARWSTYVIILAVISYCIYKSKLADFFKATWTNIPVAVALVLIGITTYRIQWLSYTLGTIITLGTLICLYKTKKSWMYYVPVLFTSIILLIMNILKIEI